MSELLKPLDINGYIGIKAIDEPLSQFEVDVLATAESRQALDRKRLEVRRVSKCLFDTQIESVANRQELIGDKLTGCYSRWYFQLRKQELLEEVEDPIGKIAIIYFDLNDFKYINDHFGHDVGDQMLTKFGNFLNENFRDDDMVFRIGGDEFAVICQQIDVVQAGFGSELDDDQPLTRRSDRFTESLHDAIVAKMSEIQNLKIQCPNGEVSVTFSWGLAVLEFGDENLTDTEIRADHEMYQYKKRSNRIGHLSIIVRRFVEDLFR